MRALANVGGFSAVAMTGESPCLIIRHASSKPHVQNLRGKGLHSLSDFNADTCEHGFVSVDTDVSYPVETGSLILGYTKTHDRASSEQAACAQKPVSRAHGQREKSTSKIRLSASHIVLNRKFML